MSEPSCPVFAEEYLNSLVPNRTEDICKGTPIPEDWVIVGQTANYSCPNIDGKQQNNAWKIADTRTFNGTIDVCKCSPIPKTWGVVGQTANYSCPTIDGLQANNAWKIKKLSLVDDESCEQLSREEELFFDQFEAGASVTIRRNKQTPPGWAIVDYTYDPGSPLYLAPNEKDNAKVIVKQPQWLDKTVSTPTDAQ